MNKDTRRLDYVWYLLGSDFVRPYLRGMWFPFEDEDMLSHIRKELLIDDLPTFYSDPDERVYRRLVSVRTRFGGENLSKFLLWQKSVLVIAGQDRVTESWWYGTLFRLVDTLQNGWRADLDVTLRSVVAELRRQDADFKASVAASKRRLSDHDKNLFQKQASNSIDDEVETVSSMIVNTLRANALVQVWRGNASTLQLDQLTELREIAQRIDGTHGGVPEGSVPLPGLWDFDLEFWMNPGPQTAHPTNDARKNE